MSYNDDSDGLDTVLAIALLIGIFIGVVKQCNKPEKSSTAKKYEQYIELKEQKVQDSINRLHYKWNKDLDNKIKKLKHD